jgi:hypothetical protein
VSAVSLVRPDTPRQATRSSVRGGRTLRRTSGPSLLHSSATSPSSSEMNPTPALCRSAAASVAQRRDMYGAVRPQWVRDG